MAGQHAKAKTNELGGKAKEFGSQAAKTTAKKSAEVTQAATQHVVNQSKSTIFGWSAWGQSFVRKARNYTVAMVLTGIFVYGFATTAPSAIKDYYLKTTPKNP